MAEKLVLPLI